MPSLIVTGEIDGVRSFRGSDIHFAVDMRMDGGSGKGPSAGVLPIDGSIGGAYVQVSFDSVEFLIHTGGRTMSSRPSR
jgi:hypothetical protein